MLTQHSPSSAITGKRNSREEDAEEKKESNIRPSTS
jgi:hypothetical protein